MHNNVTQLFVQVAIKSKRDEDSSPEQNQMRSRRRKMARWRVP